MRIDLHVHSKYSTRPSQWFLQKIGCPESFTEPMAVYRIARERGMTRVTITDHNRISGVLEIAHLPDVFISEEITSYFPEDGCKIHVLAFDITESEHDEIQKVRENIYDLTIFLNARNIIHAVAHPLYAVNERLEPDHFEKLLLLFRNFELNGSRSDRINQSLTSILKSLSFRDVNEIAEKHHVEPVGIEPWRKNIIGGSDDHSGLNIARTHTQVENAYTLSEFFEGIEIGRAKPFGEPASPLTMAHNLYGIAYQFYHSRFKLNRFSGEDELLTFLNRILMPEEQDNPGLVAKIYSFWNGKRRRNDRDTSDSLQALLKRETRKLIRDDPEFFEISKIQNAQRADLETRWFEFVNKVSDSIFIHFADHLMDHLAGANVFNVFHTIGSAGGLYTLTAPYFIAYTHFTKDKAIAKEMERRLIGADSGGKSRGGPKVAHFTDTFHEVNGVALTLQKQMEVARKNKLDLTMITCHAGERPVETGVKHFKAVGAYALPEYPELTIFYPPLLDILHYCHDSNFSQIHSATPGPVGLAALAVARMLKLPICGTYHTQIPQYIAELTGDEVMEELSWKYVLWYYDQMDTIRVPSKSTRKELVEKGIDSAKIEIYPRGIDVDQYHPERRNGIFSSRYGISANIKKLLYVGRVSREKNLPLLVEAFSRLCSQRNDVHLLVVGDGPYRPEMMDALAGKPVTFTGYLEGDDLADVYASSDIFVFPSATDTFGNVVLEAQASGIPVIVSDQGGPCENIIPNKTGLVVTTQNAEALFRAMEILITDSVMAGKMGRAARSYMADRSFNVSFLKTWKMYKKLEQSIFGYTAAH